MELISLIKAGMKTKGDGVIIASVWPAKNGMFSLKFKGKVRDGKELRTLTNEEIAQLVSDCVKNKPSFLLVPSKRQREGKKDPSHIVFGYPKQ